MASMDPFAGLKKAKEDYKVYDSHYEKIGKVDDLLVDDRDEVLYVGVKMGFLGTNSTIIPTEIVRVNDKRQLIEISEPADTVKHAPHFKHGDDLTPELENHVRSYYGLEGLRPTPEHAGDYSSSADDSRFAPDPRVDVVPGERAAAREGQIPESSTSSSRHPVDIPLDDVPEYDTPERDNAPRRDNTPQRDNAPQRSARDSDEGRWETEQAGGGVRVHRLRR
ncbi:MAG: PRC-barrel domain-containing protein [Actinomycetota bacterium]|nr:PRC-barrel domain-containing protein [Actinomycetota bacterium]